MMPTSRHMLGPQAHGATENAHTGAELGICQAYMPTGLHRLHLQVHGLWHMQRQVSKALKCFMSSALYCFCNTLVLLLFNLGSTISSQALKRVLKALLLQVELLQTMM